MNMGLVKWLLKRAVFGLVLWGVIALAATFCQGGVVS